jgi:hypothetical protein
MFNSKNAEIHPHNVFKYVVYSKQRSFPDTELTDWSL